jgi:hypothetical protein
LDFKMSLVSFLCVIRYVVCCSSNASAAEATEG